MDSIARGRPRGALVQARYRAQHPPRRARALCKQYNPSEFVIRVHVILPTILTAVLLPKLLRSISNRLKRLNKANQIRKQKKDASWLQRRTGVLNGVGGSSKLIGIISLSESADSREFLNTCLLKEASQVKNNDEHLPNNIINAVYAKHKSRCTFISSQGDRDLLETLDIAKVADILVFLIDCRDYTASSGFLDEVRSIGVYREEEHHDIIS